MHNDKHLIMNAVLYIILMTLKATVHACTHAYVTQCVHPALPHPLKDYF